MKLLKIIGLIIVLCCAFNLTGCTRIGKYKENLVYSEKVLSNFSDVNLNEQLEQILLRDEAIEYALGIFEKCFSKKLFRDELNESVNIVKLYGQFYWNINWQKIENGELVTQYYFLVNSSTKEIENCGIIRASDYYEKNNENAFEIYDEDITSTFDIAKPLLTELKISYKEYDIKASSKNNNISLILTSDSKNFEVEVNVYTKELISFSVLRGER